MLSLALAGKPNAGKSTFYTAATRADVDVANYPFTTIDANRGVATVRTDCPCLELEERCGTDRCHDGVRYVPIELYDVAGLVPGAHEGRGLGNQFLDELTNADAILNVLDASGSTDEEGEPVEPGSHDPVEDVEFIEAEMNQWLTGIIDRNWESVERKSRSPDFDINDALTELLTGFGATTADVASCLRDIEYPDDPIQWEDADKEALAAAVRAQTKPIILVANKVDIADDETLARLQEAAEIVIPATADGELALRRAVEAGVVDYDPGDDDFEIVGDISDEQAAGLEQIREVMAEHGGTGVQTALNAAVFDLLDHITAFPVENETKWVDGQGNVLPDAFLLPEGSTPTDLAAKIHSDIAEGYLHAVNGKTNRRISDSYELEDGDVIKIVSTAS
ncbi:redox-regulated ATPase YchF [Halonotius roseus]|uniref:Redox-regulated ATPase YchF n=1 Tax=Halonotius roseus TaxID=2511997 RepID=A0A544QKR5_9EURY|nr:redox-regulated ATPase YchF [Halonotius roseus]TQQ78954.1 redox-regulated ATPase YchF [Halonotius roseus]